ANVRLGCLGEVPQVSASHLPQYRGTKVPEPNEAPSESVIRTQVYVCRLPKSDGLDKCLAAPPDREIDSVPGMVERAVLEGRVYRNVVHRQDEVARSDSCDVCGRVERCGVLIHREDTLSIRCRGHRRNDVEEQDHGEDS